MLQELNKWPKQAEEVMQQVRKASPLENLKSQEAVLEDRLIKVKSAIKFMEENPTFEQGLRLISEVSIY